MEWDTKNINTNILRTSQKPPTIKEAEPLFLFLYFDVWQKHSSSFRTEDRLPCVNKNWQGEKNNYIHWNYKQFKLQKTNSLSAFDKKKLCFVTSSILI